MTIDKSEFQAQAPFLRVPIYLANIRKQASIKALLRGRKPSQEMSDERLPKKFNQSKTKLAYWEFR